MKVIKDVTEVTLEVQKDDLLDNHWFGLTKLTCLLSKKEDEDCMKYKALRNKFYNSERAGKYNVQSFYGFKFINIDKPMKAVASLKLNFTRV